MLINLFSSNSPLLLIILGIFLPSIESTEFLIPLKPIEQSNEAEIGENYATLSGILLPEFDAYRPNKLLDGEFVYSVKIEFMAASKPPGLPNMKIFVKTNEYGGFKAKIPAKYEAENKNLKLTFAHPNQRISIELTIFYLNSKSTYGCRTVKKDYRGRVEDNISGDALSPKYLIELEGESAKIKARKNNPSMFPWETFDEILLEMKKIVAKQNSDIELIGNKFKEVNKENGNIQTNIYNLEGAMNYKFYALENKLRERGFFEKIFNKP